jgi:hypothetical protein
MRSILRHLLNPLARAPQRSRRDWVRADQFFADPEVVEDDYRHMRRGR